MVMFLRNITIFLENISIFFGKHLDLFWKHQSLFATGECIKTKPAYPIVSCRGRVRLPEDTKQTVFGRANLAPTNETTALSTF